MLEIIHRVVDYSIRRLDPILMGLKVRTEDILVVSQKRIRDANTSWLFKSSSYCYSCYFFTAHR